MMVTMDQVILSIQCAFAMISVLAVGFFYLYYNINKMVDKRVNAILENKQKSENEMTKRS